VAYIDYFPIVRVLLIKLQILKKKQSAISILKKIVKNLAKIAIDTHTSRAFKNVLRGSCSSNSQYSNQ